MTLTPDLLLSAYQIGAFPMADDAGQIGWYAPDPRGIIPLDEFRVRKSLRRVVRYGKFRVTADAAFEEVIRACAAPARGRELTWISEDIVRAYTELHRRGNAHSVETWAGGELVGGLYGVRLGAAFFGESMFHIATDASKVALVHLVDRLRAGGFQLLDTQWTTAHLEQFGATEISRQEYDRRLHRAVNTAARWAADE